MKNMTSIDENESFMDVLEELRVARGIGKLDIAIHAGISPEDITDLTKGKRTTPSEKSSAFNG